MCVFFKKSLILNLIFVFVYSFGYVYSFIFCTFCIVKNAGKLSPGIAPPPFPLVTVGWGRSTSLSHTSLDLTPSTACTGSHIARGREGGRDSGKS